MNGPAVLAGARVAGLVSGGDDQGSRVGLRIAEAQEGAIVQMASQKTFVPLGPRPAFESASSLARALRAPLAQAAGVGRTQGMTRLAFGTVDCPLRLLAALYAGLVGSGEQLRDTRTLFAFCAIGLARRELDAFNSRVLDGAGRCGTGSCPRGLPAVWWPANSAAPAAAKRGARSGSRPIFIRTMHRVSPCAGSTRQRYTWRPKWAPGFSIAAHVTPRRPRLPLPGPASLWPRWTQSRPVASFGPGWRRPATADPTVATMRGHCAATSRHLSRRRRCHRP
jgi:hypothetical protein